jgi:hypothetical protein
LWTLPLTGAVERFWQDVADSRCGSLCAAKAVELKTKHIAVAGTILLARHMIYISPVQTFLFVYVLETHRSLPTAIRLISAVRVGEKLSVHVAEFYAYHQIFF